MKFYDDISIFYEDIFPLGAKKLKFIEKRTKKGDKLLDIGCATGELFFKLQGISGYGIDLDKKMLDFAKSRDKSSQYSLTDMMAIDKKFDFQFDSILCLGNTLVHLKNSEEVFTFFKKVKGLLKPGANFIIQVINYSHIYENSLKSLPLIENGLLRFERYYENLERGKSVDFKTKLLIKENGQVFENVIKLFPIEKTEIEELLKKSGFEDIEFFSGFDEAPWNENSLRTVIYTK